MVTPLSLFHPRNEGQTAVLSPCRTWRYALERRWGSGPFVLFVGLNPSTADEHVDDPTIRRCIGFAKDWGFGGLLMGNLYAYRATRPVDLWSYAKMYRADPVGPDNDVWLGTMRGRSSLIVAAWGGDPMAEKRVSPVLDILGDVQCLGITKGGAPRHPLYLAKATKPEPFAQAERDSRGANNQEHPS